MNTTFGLKVFEGFPKDTTFRLKVFEGFPNLQPSRTNIFEGIQKRSYLKVFKKKNISKTYKSKKRIES